MFILRFGVYTLLILQTNFKVIEAACSISTMLIIRLLPDDLHHLYLACPMIDIISLLNAKSYLILGDEIEAGGYENNAAT